MTELEILRDACKCLGSDAHCKCCNECKNCGAECTGRQYLGGGVSMNVCINPECERGRYRIWLRENGSEVSIPYGVRKVV